MRLKDWRHVVRLAFLVGSRSCLFGAKRRHPAGRTHLRLLRTVGAFGLLFLEKPFIFF